MDLGKFLKSGAAAVTAAEAMPFALGEPALGEGTADAINAVRRGV